MAELKPGSRLPLLFFGMLSLLGGVMAGLARLGWEVPGPAMQAAGVHGPLMIAAFFGTVISLERAVAAGRNWAYLAPLAAGASGIALLAGTPLLIGQILGCLAALGLIAASAVALNRQVAVFTIILTLAATCWLVGNLLWLATGDISVAVSWWLLFLVLTIAGERLELTRFLPTPPLAQKLFIAIVGAMLLYEPQSGKKTRYKLQRTRDALRHQAVDAGEAVEDMVAKAGGKARDAAEEIQVRGGEMLDNGKARINAAVDAGKAAVHRAQA